LDGNLILDVRNKFSAQSLDRTVSWHIAAKLLQGIGLFIVCMHAWVGGQCNRPTSEGTSITILTTHQLTCFSKFVVYCFLVGRCVESFAVTADEVIRCVVVEVSQQSADARVLLLGRQLYSHVQLKSTSRYHSRRTYNGIRRRLTFVLSFNGHSQNLINALKLKCFKSKRQS